MQIQLADNHYQCHLYALNIANKYRMLRGQLKRELSSREQHEGKLLLAQILRRPTPWFAQNLTIYDALTSIHNIGRYRALKYLMPLNINEDKTLDALTGWQRQELIRRLELSSEWEIRKENAKVA